jgi:3-oxoacyl-[acyl-carrier protein] reductase
MDANSQQPPFDITGQSAVVTGSSSGIGRAIAVELARAGANVLVHARRSADAAERVADEIREMGRDATVVLYDLVEPENQTMLVHKAWKWKPIDIWVNNAGADVLTGTEAEWSFDQKFTELWSVDVTATVRLGRDVGRRMKKRSGGVILNMGWDQAESGMEGDSGELFATIKGAVMAFTRSLAKSLAPEARAVCVAPGWIKTAWGDRASEYWQQRAERESLAGRWGTPEDVARVVRFVVSPQSDYMNCQTIAVNGGLAK